ncbi:hypothetical protein Dfri01_59560 [Dyadobacter frigoris]|uniref:hypothetical protein n=1 Tax=Dyadobacter frigoris TaxID=2576211 RepID=UPI0024A2FBE7|nr:hypothetical protein [Dyadobacter frigoris]GLU56495.1 hypothetical protein Dfri01_59560 [Dyadobacter frigoris]
MESKKKTGRPSLSEDDLRSETVRIWLTKSEKQKLRLECEGSNVDFAVFCREKLLNREARVLRKPIPEDVKMQMTNLLKMSGSVLLLAKNTSSDTIISDEFKEMAAGLKRIVQRADYSIKELVHSQSLIAGILPLVNDIERKATAVGPQSEVTLQLLESVKKLKAQLIPFAQLYNLEIK